MGPLGWQEMMFIFLLALVLFGPKKLPELGRMLGKAITEFRRAQNELKSTFEREMRNLEQEDQSLKEITGGYQYNNYNYDYSSSDTGNYGEPSTSSPTESQDSTSTSTTSASATEGVEPLSIAAPEGAIAYGTELSAGNGHAPDPEDAHEGVTESNHGDVPAASGSPATERNA